MLSFKDFQRTVADCWKKEIKGTPMYCLISKLKRLRLVLMKINREGKGDAFIKDAKKYKNMIEIQERIKEAPENTQLMDEEILARREYQQAHSDLIQFMRQKVKVDWLKNGDANTKLFHSSIRNRRIQNSIYSVWDMKGNWVDTQEGEGRKSVLTKVVQDGKVITAQQAEFLLENYTDKEVKVALFSIPDEKAPGPDGYSSTFFKQTWDITGKDLIEAVLSFLHTCKLLKELNTTTVTLVPKVKCPQNVSDYRPIACCNVVYKIATKLICSRLREVLPTIISENQSGFV
ncbi:uncharacterized protein LOC133806576 [Humulus lupulus]|uniref:uncharacterized protein LOC133806576 n=1 Tax=Humulus lupulus TaxID=3486 RepID=UPI002B40B335|nr:uncharacterized protein LOC133806576 [Humulus lupulus]